MTATEVVTFRDEGRRVHSLNVTERIMCVCECSTCEPYYVCPRGGLWYAGSASSFRRMSITTLAMVDEYLSMTKQGCEPLGAFGEKKAKSKP